MRLGELLLISTWSDEESKTCSVWKREGKRGREGGKEKGGPEGGKEEQREGQTILDLVH